MKLSFVVPVYNVEQYIVKCISSLLQQDYDDYEIIIVDDGSPDKSIEMLQSTISDKRITIVHQSNAGLSAARNTGLKHSRGEYVWFVDSDDWIAENCMGNIVEYLNGCDILYFNSHYNVSDSTTTASAQNFTETNGKHLSMKDIHYPVQYYIYRRAFIEKSNLCFEVGLLHEDTLFTPIALYLAHDIVPYNQPVYYQYARDESITHTINPKRCYDLMYIIEKHSAFAANQVSISDRYLWGNCIANSIVSMLALSLECDKDTQKDVGTFLSTHKAELKYLCHSRKSYSQVLGYILNYWPFSPIGVYKLLHKMRYSEFFPKHIC